MPVTVSRRSPATERPRAVGTVSLVGAGPGAADLLTLRAVERLRSADLVAYDYLVDEAVLAHCRPDCRRLFVGKRAGHHACSQQEINALMASSALGGEQVVRLKGGDPLIFGRGGEERAYLRALGVPCEIVPGITSGIAAAASVGDGLTHRDYAGTVAFLTGHARGGELPAHDWSALARIDTLVCYMAVARLATIAAELIAAGRAPTTPVAAVRWATRTEQEVLRGDLAAARADAIAGLAPPAVVIIGAAAHAT